MIVVTDASPMLYLVLLGADHLLPGLYQNVICPETVLQECCHPQAPEKLRQWAAHPPDWLHVLADSADALPGLLQLDPGERAAIQTAHALGARIVLMDEKKGRLAAESLGLVAVGVIGIITTAARQGMIDFEPMVGRLIETTNFRVSDAVIDRASAALARPPDVT
jgi:predicted nucleic acid-binding protein